MGIEEREEKEFSIITLQRFKDKPPEEIRVPFSEGEVESIRIMHDARHELSQCAADSSGPIRDLHFGYLFLLWGYTLTNRENTLRIIRRSKELAEYALSEERFCPERLRPTLLRIKGEIDKLIPEDEE